MNAAEIIEAMKRARGACVTAYRLTPQASHPEHLRASLEAAERAGTLRCDGDSVSWRDATGGVWLLTGNGGRI